ncbi:MAG: hypothetical protein KF709_14720 [Gemmatimonadaceae bacterium]|nr:hypothetical protein [Gemmatimonadaceae bacterium]
MAPLRRSARLLLLCPLVVATACLPYTTGSTGQTVPIGERHSFGTAGLVINGGGQFDDSASTSSDIANIPMSDSEVRFGLSERSDLGIRITSASGLVMNYKRRHAGYAHPDSAGFSTMWGGGIVNWGGHALVEATAIVSGRRNSAGIPYGGLRAFHTMPISRGAVTDKPTVGGFLGMKFILGDVSISPELGVFYDESVLALRRGNIVVVPAVALSGFSFFRIFR